MRLVDAIRDLTLLDKEATIYAAPPWTVESEAMVAREPDDQILPCDAEVRGLKYFLEVILARELLEDLEASLDTEPTLKQKCEWVITYAMNDA